MKYRIREQNELKPSGVEWLGDIPKDWQVKKLKYISEIISSNVDKKSYEGQKKVLLCNYVDVYKNDFITNKIDFMEATASESEIKKFSLQLGDILITKDSESPNDIAIPAYVNEKFENVLCGYHLSILRNNKNKVYSEYLYRFFQLIGVRNYFETMAKGVTRYGLSLDAFKSIFVPYLDLIEQQKIANFLDEKSKIFDEAISKKEQLISKLELAKQSLISEVVTGKLKIVEQNSKLQTIKREQNELKASKVEWLGDIPKNWQVKKIKYLYSLRNERNYEDKDKVELLSLYTSLGVKRQKDIENKTGNKSQTVYEYKKVYRNDIVVNIILAWMGSIGISYYDGVTSPAYDIYKPLKDVDSNYYNYLFRTEKFAGECFKQGRGIMLMRWRTYSDEFKSIFVYCPSFNEQQKISKYLDEKLIHFDNTIEKTKQSIKKLKLAKEALISQAVTGKIEVL